MDYLQKLEYHYKPQKGWINDPNGLVYFKGYYHIFYQHVPDYEIHVGHPMHWGHARTKDFVHYEELPIALYPDKDYDCCGCWSGTAIVKDDVLYLFYASVKEDRFQTVSIAYSSDGINFQKYENNPFIDHYPQDGGHDFRDPAVCCVDGVYYLVMATGHIESNTGRLLLYKSEDILNWDYVGVMCQWENCRLTECPSFVEAEDGMHLLAASVCPAWPHHYFSMMYGIFKDNKFEIKYTAEVDKGPDQYAGQVFRDHKGRNILISWMSGWQYSGFAEKSVGCMSIPKEIKLENGEITAWPIEEVQFLLKDSDPALKRTETGFIVEREKRDPVVYEGEIEDLKVIRDGYIIEIFINGGKEVYSVLL